MNHLWNMGDGGWVETRKDGHYLCSSYTSKKGFTRGNTTSSEKKLSEEEYKDLLEKEEAWNLSIQAEKEARVKREEEKAARIEAYQRISPLCFDGTVYEITVNGEIRCEGNFITYVPRKMPISEIEARKLIISEIIEAVNFIE